MTPLSSVGRAVLVAFVACTTLALGQVPPSVVDGAVGTVRVLRIGTDDEPLDVWLGGTRLAVDLGPGMPSGYVVVPAGPSEVGLAASGDEDAAGPTSTLGQVDVPPGAYATLIVPGTQPSADQASDVRTPVLIEDALTQLPPAGHAGLRLVHVAPELPALALAVRRLDERAGERPRDAEDPPDEEQRVARVEPMRGSAYATLAAGRQRIWIVREDGTQVLTEPLEISLRAGTVYTLVVAAAPSASARVSVAVDASSASTSALGSEDDGPSWLRVLHASPDAPRVDVLVNGMARLRDVASGTLTPYTDVAPGTHLLEVYPHRLPRPMTEPGNPTESAGSTETGDASTGDGAVARDGAPAGEASNRSTSVRRLEPVTALVDVPEGRYTTLVLAGRYQPAASTSEMGGLSVSVEPADASVTVQGPEGDVVAGQPGPKLLDGLPPGTYRVEVRKAGYRSARYEVDVSPDTTAVLSVTLQESQEASDGEEDGSGEGGPQGAGPDFVNVSVPQGERRSLELHVYPTAIPIAAPGAARVRFVHAAPTVPPLDVVASPPQGADDAADGRSDGLAASFEGLAYPNASEYLRIGAGTIVLTFRVAGSENRIRRLETVELRPGTSYSLFLVARSPSLRFSVVPAVDAIVPQRRFQPEER